MNLDRDHSPFRQKAERGVLCRVSPEIEALHEHSIVRTFAGRPTEPRVCYLHLRTYLSAGHDRTAQGNARGATEPKAARKQTSPETPAATKTTVPQMVNHEKGSLLPLKIFALCLFLTTLMS